MPVPAGNRPALVYRALDPAIHPADRARPRACGTTRRICEPFWLEIRKLRNQMVHEYIEDAAILINALQSGHAYVPVLISAAASLMAQIDKLAPP